MALPLPLSCAVMLLLALPPNLSVLAVTQEVAIFTGQQFADEVVKWGKNGGDVTLVITVPLISLRNATWPNVTDYPPPSSDPGSPFSSGHLTITSANMQNYSIIDEGYRSALIPYMRGTSSYTLNGLGRVNLCATEIKFTSMNQATQQTVINTYTSALFTALFTGGFPQQAPSDHNTRSYVTQSDLAAALYLRMMMGATNLKPLFEATRQRTEILTGAHPLLNVQPYSADIGENSSGISSGTFIMSINSPEDPMLQHLHAQQLLPPPQFCNGTVLPPAFVIGPNPDEGPLWIANDTTSFLKGMAEAAALTTLQAQFKGLPPAVLVVDNVSLAAPGHSTPHAWQLDSPFWLAGPPGTAKQQAGKVMLDLADLTCLFVLHPPVGQLAIQGLVVTGLGITSAAGNTASVFPLTAVTVTGSSSGNNSSSSSSSQASISSQGFSGTVINDGSGSYIPVWLDDVTLVVGQADFLALAALVMTLPKQSDLRSVAGCLDPAAADVAAYLASGITEIQALYPPSDPLRELVLSSFYGWGINGTSVRVVPLQPISATVSLSACQPSTDGTDDAHALPARKAGLIAGLVGAAVLLVGLTVAAVCMHGKVRRHQGLPVKSPPSVLQSSDDSRVQVNHHQQEVVTGSSSLLWLMQQRAAHHAAILDVDSGTGTTEQSQVTCSHDTASKAGSSAQPTAVEVAGTQAVLTTGHLATAWALKSGHGASWPMVERLNTGGASSQHAQEVETLAASLSDDAANQVAITGVLGQGASGTVFHGIWRGLHVALKTVVLPAEQALQQAVMEAAIAASVGHPNVVATYHYDFKPISDTHKCQTQGDLQVHISSGVMDDDASKGVDAASQGGHAACALKLYLVQELCMASLAAVLSENMLHEPDTGCVKPDDVLPIIADIACGLAYLHSRGIIHADLKPANVLLKIRAGTAAGVVAKLTDFGLSVHLAHDHSHVSGFTRGTPFYVAPEVVLTQRASPASDIYSLGVIMWELYAGKSPYVYDSDDAPAVWNPSFPSLKPPNVPPEAYYQLMLSCLNREPARRPSATQVLNTISEVCRQYNKLTASAHPSTTST